MQLDWNKYDIDISKIRGGKTICPKCSHNRKHKSDPCLSINLKEGLFNCHNCDFAGSANVFEKAKKEFSKPIPRLEKVGEKMIEWFLKRGITNNTLLRFGVTETKEWMPQTQKEMNCICFNFYRGDDIVNIKFRDGNKNFKLVSGAELIFFNLNSIKGDKTAVIVEGEIDSLAMYEAGVFNSVSVPNGASKGSQKLEYLDNCWQDFEGKEKIIIAVDNDEAGEALKEELSRRLGKERCFLVKYPEGCKDANEVLLRYGKDDLKAMVDNATAYPLEGILTVDDLAEQVLEYYLNGYPKGADCGIAGIDQLITFVAKQLTVITGEPGAGKDEILNAITMGLAEKHDWKFGIAGFEEEPVITVTKLLEKHTDKAFDFRKNPNHRMNMEQFEKGLLFVNDHYYFINTDEADCSVTGILSKFGQMVKKYGITGVIISPWNRFEHKREAGISETEYIGKCLSEMILFSKMFNCHVFLVAHPTKLQKNLKTGKTDVPNLYNISGSANFYNMTHNGFSVTRDKGSGIVDFYNQKIKFSWLGKLGFCSFNYNTMTRQYEFMSLNGGPIAEKPAKPGTIQLELKSSYNNEKSENIEKF